MKKLFLFCVLALGSMTAFSVMADDNNQQECVPTEQTAVPCTPAPCPNQVPCDTTTTCTPAPCTPAPCYTGC